MLRDNATPMDRYWQSGGFATAGEQTSHRGLQQCQTRSVTRDR